MNVAVILAGGIGSRLNSGLPKQFLEVKGRLIIEYTIDTFEQNELIDEILVVINPAYIHKMGEVVQNNQWRKVCQILPGGVERYDSSMTAIQYYSGRKGVNLLFHDAVRPLVSPRIIQETIQALRNYSAVNVAIPAVDTIISVEGNFIDTVPDRSKLMRSQTPQGFRLEVIEKAYRLAMQDPTFKSTDDCGVVLKYLPEEKIFIVRGEEINMKLTYSEDIYLLERFILLRCHE